VRTSPAPTQRAYQLPPDKYQAALNLNRQLDLLHFAAFGWTLLVIALLIRFRTGQRLAKRGAWSIAAVAGILWISSLPFPAYRHWLGLSFGLSIEPWAPWFLDQLKGGLIETGLFVAFGAAGFALARRSPRRWWLYGWGAATLIIIAATYAVPLIFDPLFHRFTRLERTHPDLLGPILAVAKEAGFDIPPDRIYEMDASEKTRTLNAYMTGFGSSKRIVLWDTTIRRLAPRQVQTVFAHELGHYALGHIPRSILLGSIGLLAVFWLARRQPIEYARLPQLLLIITVVSFLSEPLVNSYSRWQEQQADDYELNIMSRLIPNAGTNSAQVDQLIAEISLDVPNPTPLIEL
jgi:Zn-dependent protease with chaperone function